MISIFPEPKPRFKRVRSPPPPINLVGPSSSSSSASPRTPTTRAKRAKISAHKDDDDDEEDQDKDGEDEENVKVKDKQEDNKDEKKEDEDEDDIDDSVFTPPPQPPPHQQGPIITLLVQQSSRGRGVGAKRKVPEEQEDERPTIPPLEPKRRKTPEKATMRTRRAKRKAKILDDDDDDDDDEDYKPGDEDQDDEDENDLQDTEEDVNAIKHFIREEQDGKEAAKKKKMRKNKKEKKEQEAKEEQERIEKEKEKEKEEKEKKERERMEKESTAVQQMHIRPVSSDRRLNFFFSDADERYYEEISTPKVRLKRAQQDFFAINPDFPALRREDIPALHRPSEKASFVPLVASQQMGLLVARFNRDAHFRRACEHQAAEDRRCGRNPTAPKIVMEDLVRTRLGSSSGDELDKLFCKFPWTADELRYIAAAERRVLAERAEQARLNAPRQRFEELGQQWVEVVHAEMAKLSKAKRKHAVGRVSDLLGVGTEEVVHVHAQALRSCGLVYAYAQLTEDERLSSSLKDVSEPTLWQAAILNTCWVTAPPKKKPKPGARTITSGFLDEPDDAAANPGPEPPPVAAELVAKRLRNLETKQKDLTDFEKVLAGLAAKGHDVSYDLEQVAKDQKACAKSIQSWVEFTTQKRVH